MSFSAPTGQKISPGPFENGRFPNQIQGRHRYSYFSPHPTTIHIYYLRRMGKNEITGYITMAYTKANMAPRRGGIQSSTTPASNRPIGEDERRENSQYPGVNAPARAISLARVPFSTSRQQRGEPRQKWSIAHGAV